MSKKKNKESKKGSFFKKNGFNLITALLAIAAIIISLLTYFQSEDIAIKSGAYDKGDLKFQFGGYPIIHSMKYDIYYGINFREKELNFSNLPVGIFSSGNKTVEGVHIFYRYPNQTQIAVQDSVMKMESIFMDKMDRKFQKDRDFDNVSFDVGNINPKVEVNIGDLIFLNKETKQKFSFPVKTKDNIEIMAKGEISYSFPIEIGISAKDIESSTYFFSLNIRNQINLDHLIKQIVNEKLEERKKNNTTSSAFFVTIPNVESSKKEINILNSNGKNTLLVQFDKDFKNYVIYNTNGEIKNIFRI